jgi:hypothetical protein
MTDQQATSRALLAAIAVALGFAAAPVHAAIVPYIAFDPGAGSLAAAPNSVAEDEAFDAELGTEKVIDFESAPLGAFVSLAAAPGVTVTGLDFNGNNQKIVNTTLAGCTPALCGYNTTTGGSKFLQLNGGTATFSFSPGIDAFGAYFTGVQLTGETITFSDGVNQSIAIPNPGNSGGTDFVGFTDFGKTILSLTINAQPTPALGDIIGVDDVGYETVPAPPTGGNLPAVLAVCVALLGAKLVERGQNRRRRATGST